MSRSVSRGKASRISGATRSRRGWGSAKRTPYKGVVYASKSEAAYARHLDVLKKAGVVRSWTRQVRWKLIVNGRLVCTMVPDFRVEWKDGTASLIEVKGHPTAVYRLKRKLFEALHPEVDYRVVNAREALSL